MSDRLTVILPPVLSDEEREQVALKLCRGSLTDVSVIAYSNGDGRGYGWGHGSDSFSGNGWGDGSGYGWGCGDGQSSANV